MLQSEVGPNALPIETMDRVCYRTERFEIQNKILLLYFLV